MSIEFPKETWGGSVREVVLGATAADGGTRSHTLTIGGEDALPFLFQEGSIPNAPLLAIEIKDRQPDDWSEILNEAWGEAMQDPGDWARAAEEAGADLICLTLSATTADGSTTTPEIVVAALKKILAATGLPLIVTGTGQVDLDNELLIAIAEAGEGERLVLGLCEENNYRTIVAAALAHNHLVQTRAPMDVNLSKQLNILIHDMGLPLERILMDPTTGGLGYGIEYGFSVMERLRLAALQGDSMTQQPMIVTPGEEVWKLKEAKSSNGVPEEWGDWKTRALEWEAVTAITLVNSAANIIVLRHPDNVRRIRTVIKSLMNTNVKA